MSNRHFCTSVILCCLGLACTPDDSASFALEHCDNEIDDDGNGLADCADPRCSTAPHCLATTDCGDGVRKGAEFCDGDDLGNASCESQNFLAGTLRCRADCSGFDTSSCIRPDRCGNDRLDPTEECDGADLASATCLSRGYAEGVLGCKDTCEFDESACTGTNPCGNGMLDAGEVCDGAELDGQSCASLSPSLVGDALACASDCTAFDSSACEPNPCGNGRLDPGEVCDGNLFADGASCQSEGFASGLLGCNATCDGLETGDCSTCGNEVVDAGEVCDGRALDSQSCQTRGFALGTLACLADCTAFDTSNCTNCGNGTLEGEEVCDGDPETAPSPLFCDDLGYAAGTLACRSDCSGYDASDCTGFVECGNGVLDGLPGNQLYQEWCEPGLPFYVEPFTLARTPLNGGCSAFSASGDVSCNADCTLDVSQCTGSIAEVCTALDVFGFDWFADGRCDDCIRQEGLDDPQCIAAEASPPVCGDGIADGALNVSAFGLDDFPSAPFDRCDGEDLRGQTCESLGFKSGTLACRADCQFDVTQCLPTECGDGIVQGREVCEDTQDCTDFGFASGDIICINSCLTVSFAGCS